MSFYVTLPSNASMKEFPKNIQTDYTTLLSEPIILNNPYEVALTEINYSTNIGLEMGSISFPNCLLNKIRQSFDRVPTRFQFNLIFKNGIKTEQLVNKLNQWVKETVFEHEYKYRYKLSQAASLNQAILHNYFYTEKNKENHLLVLKKTTHFEIIEVEASRNKQDYLKSNGKYDEQKSKWIFNDVTLLKSKFKLMVLVVPDNYSFENNYERENEIKTVEDINKLINNCLNSQELPFFSFDRENKLHITYKNEADLIINGMLAKILNDKDEIIINEPKHFQFFKI